jgi:sulfur carrier protein
MFSFNGDKRFHFSFKNITYMKITVNGKEQQVTGNEIGLLDLIKQNHVQQPDMVSVQLQGTFVDRKNFEKTTVKDGDEVDFLYFMGGGQ